jgi:hypothetical protein
MGKPDIRISNAERDAAVTALGQHLSTGRLELSEYEERCGQAAAARTRGELEALFADLPAPHPDLSSAAAPGKAVAIKRSKQATQTPASQFFEVIAGLTFVLGVPGAILLTIFAGAGWVFIPVGLVFFIAAILSEASKKKPKG